MQIKSICYTPTTENITVDTILYIYDFGNKKGFLYKNDFTLYKILQKDFIENIGELQEKSVIDENIPMNICSIEKYPCIFEKNIFKIPFYNISFTELAQETVLYFPLPSPQQRLQLQQPVQQQQNRNNKKITVYKTLVPQDGVHVKRQQELQNQQTVLVNPSVVQQQWMSLDQVMKSPSSLALQSRHQEHSPTGKYFQPLLKPSPSLQLRQPQKQGVKVNQLSTKKYSSPNQAQELVKQ